MKDLCEQYIREKCDKAKRWTLEAARDEKNGHHDSAQNLLKMARAELESGIREIDRYGKVDSVDTVVEKIS